MKTTKRFWDLDVRDSDERDPRTCDICGDPIPDRSRVLEVDLEGPPAEAWEICERHHGVLEGLDGEELVAAIRARILARGAAR